MEFYPREFEQKMEYGVVSDMLIVFYKQVKD